MSQPTFAESLKFGINVGGWGERWPDEQDYPSIDVHLKYRWTPPGLAMHHWDIWGCTKNAPGLPEYWMHPQALDKRLSTEIAAAVPGARSRNLGGVTLYVPVPDFFIHEELTPDPEIVANLKSVAVAKRQLISDEVSAWLSLTEMVQNARRG